MLQHLENHVLMENTLHFILIKIIYIFKKNTSYTKLQHKQKSSRNATV